MFLGRDGLSSVLIPDRRVRRLSGPLSVLIEYFLRVSRWAARKYGGLSGGKLATSGKRFGGAETWALSLKLFYFVACFVLPTADYHLETLE